MRLVTFPQTQTVVRDLTKRTPPCFPPDFTSRQFPHKSVSVVTTHLSPSYVNRLCHYTTLPYGLGILGVASHGVTTQMTYFTTCLFHLPHGTSVLLFLYLTRLVSLVTICFTSLYLNVKYSFVLASLKSHPSSFYSFPYLFPRTSVLSSHLRSTNLGHIGDRRHNIYVEA